MSAAAKPSPKMQVTSAPVPQPGDFALTGERAARAERVLASYPAERKMSAMIPLLDLAQRENGGWLSPQAMDFVARTIEVAPIRVYEVASFYSMFYLQPMGQHHIQVCRTTPCWLRGSDEITAACKSKLGIGLGETTADGQFTLTEVECLGACANAPMVQINDDYYEDLTAEDMLRLIEALAAGEKPAIGSQVGRQSSAPFDGPRTLTEVK